MAREYEPWMVPADWRAEQEREATGKAGQAAGKVFPPDDPGDGLDDKTKDELLLEAETRGVEVKTSASKAEILAALRG